MNMFGATTNYPFNFANRQGIPMIESTSIETTDTNVVINIPNRAFRFLSGTGLILFRLNTEITNLTLPILFSSNNFVLPLTLAGNTGATGTDISAPGIYLLYYDKNSNLMLIIK